MRSGPRRRGAKRSLQIVSSDNGGSRTTNYEFTRARLNLKRTVLLALILGGVAVASWAYRNSEINRAYAEASGVGAFDTVAAQAAVKRLASYRGAHSTRMLVSIALGESPGAWPDAQRDAISALSTRSDEHLSAELAALLQPHEPLPTRQAAAEALKVMGCSMECIDSILHYLERALGGEPNFEDRTYFSGELGADVKADIAKDQQQLYRTLYGILAREKLFTLSALTRIYGVGTAAPSKFGLTLITKMRFQAACPTLSRSVQLVDQSSADTYLAPREELRAALKALGCPQ